MLREEIERHEFLERFNRALEEGRFETYCQPQIDYRSGKIVSAEVLTRWNHPYKGLLAHGRFLLGLESTGKIAELDEMIIEKECVNAVRWIGLYPSSSSSFSVNLSRSYILDSNLSRPLEKKIHELGMVVEMDDFGLAYSSLNSLKDIDVDVVKLDLKFLGGFWRGRNKGSDLIRWNR
jgi:EAL domain-containing protein (putative c-di-GMP-specific phosphodiesterase class I)